MGINHEESVKRENRLLQKKIILLVCTLVILFFGVIARIAILTAEKQLNQEVQAHYQMLANKTMEEVSVWIVRETQIIMNQKAALEIMDNFDPDFLTEYLTYIVEDYNYDGYIYDLYFVNTDNVMSSGYGYVPDPSIDFTRRDWYLGALDTDNICYSVPYVDTNLEKYVVTVSVKLYDKSGDFRGVLALDIFVDKLFGITKQQEMPKDSYLFLVDHEFGLVTHPNEEFGYVDEEPRKLDEMSDGGYASLKDYLLEGNAQNDYISFSDYDGIQRCFFASKVEDCNWCIVAAVSKDVIDKARKSLNGSIFIALFVCLILGMSITLWLSTRIIRKLNEAKEASYAASMAKSRFLANMSHEIRTPINAVLGMDEILLRECRDENLREYALNIQSAGQALLGLVNDILDFSKIESDKLDLVPGEYELGNLIGSCMNLIKLRLENKGLSFEVERSDYLPKSLWGDEVRIRQIISNLLTNAVKYTKEGSVLLKVNWEQTSSNEGVLLIHVRDTGIGIKPESMQELFTSFQRLDEKKNRNIEGTGLGLSITKQLAEMMGGEITVKSEYGVGSEFVVTIPQKVIDAKNVESFSSQSEEGASEQEVQLITHSTRILVVDDVRMNLEVVMGLLKKTGITIDTADSGVGALQMVNKNRYDLIFLDHMMPEMDGVETLRELKKHHAIYLGNTPVIMLTANAVMGVEEEYRKEGFAGYLSKPVNLEGLYDCLIRFLPKNKYEIIAGQEEVQKEADTVKESVESMGNPSEEALNRLQKLAPEFDKRLGLGYCGEPQMLLMMLKEYVESEMKEGLPEAYEKKDWISYKRNAHSIKSTSLMVGFQELSLAAKELEMAAKEENVDYIMAHHSEVYGKYLHVLECVTMALKET